MNHLWAGMMLIGVIYGVFTGRIDAVTDAALESAKDAVMLCITMLGVMSFWSGLMEIASRAGIIELASRKMRPLIRFLFPNIPNGHPAAEYITTNFIANFLGLGWAATPAGLQAMEALGELEEERRTCVSEQSSLRKGSAANRKRGKMWKSCSNESVPAVSQGVASKEMCDFLILNISSLQLIPMNIIAYRSQYGSVEPTAIVGPAIVATTVSTLTAVVFCKVVGGRKRLHNVV